MTDELAEITARAEKAEHALRHVEQAVDTLMVAGRQIRQATASPKRNEHGRGLVLAAKDVRDVIKQANDKWDREHAKKGTDDGK